MIVAFLFSLIITLVNTDFENCLLNNKVYCIQCQDGYYLENDDGDIQCQRCSSQCSTCYNYNRCKTCGSNQTLFMNKCYKCRIQGCSLCAKNNQCVSCNDGYYLSNKICQKCGKNCQQCDKNGVCEQCQNNYVLLSSGTCVLKQSQNKQNKDDQIQSKSKTIKNLRITIALIAIGIVILIVIFCIIRSLKKRKNKSKLKRQTQQPVSPQNQNQGQQNREDLNIGVPSSYVLLKSSKYSNPTQQSVKFLSQSDGDMCAICLSDSTDVKTSCTHRFHAQCIVVWCRRKRICPDCNNTSFTLKIMCYQCKQFNQTVKLCPTYCKQQNHYLCFQNKNKKKQLCQKCQKI